jgi:hypothetical protein
MVAIRTAGLGLSSVMGVVDEVLPGPDKLESNHDRIRLVVDEAHLRLLFRLGNQRFAANQERIERLKRGLDEIARAQDSPNRKSWEPSDARKERKRREGLLEKERKRAETCKVEDNTEIELDTEGLFPT